jgi:O-antigen ligase
VFVALLAATPLYVGARAANLWNGDGLADLVARTFGAARAQSVDFRIDQERLMVEAALQRKWLGWGRWGRALVPDPERSEWLPRTIPDSLWIVAFGESGTVGLIALGLTLLLPVAAFAWHYPPDTWTTPEVAAAAALAVVLLLYTIDGWFNAMVNPVYMLVAGGLSGLVAAARPARDAIRSS